jgi:2-iminobutanoate/2-iminopropanoate deaminase
MSDHKAVSTAEAPAAIGPYSQAIVHGGLVYCSGQIALEAQSGELIEGDVIAQTHKCLQNLRAVLQAAGSDLSQAIKVGMFLQDLEDFGSVNAVYAEYFGPVFPARACVEVARLPKDVLVEIDCVAVVKAP